jgi:DNA (cytosine-5)-methyltransferase 1
MKPFIYDLKFVKEQSSKQLFNVVSLFAGAGGSSTGYRLAGGKVLAINEFIEEAQKAYAINYPDTYIFKDDVRKITGNDILEQINLKVGELDILDGSPPCSSFSMAGKREKGWGQVKKYSDKEQRTDDLFFEYARILKEIQPKVFVAENVKGLTMGVASDLLGSDQFDLFGEEKDTIYHNLANCGYDVRFKVLNAKNYGVPQMRERTIFIGVRNDIKHKISFPMGNVVDVVTAREAFLDLQPDDFRKLSAEQNRVYDLMNYGESMSACGVRLNQKISGFGRIKISPDKPCNTATTKPELYHYEEKRTLSINELKRVCSFPDDYYCGENFFDKWERLGRSVPPLMMKAIAEHIFENVLSKINKNA